MRLLVVTDRAFRTVLERMPGIATKVLQSLGERLHAPMVDVAATIEHHLVDAGLARARLVTWDGVVEQLLG